MNDEQLHGLRAMIADCAQAMLDDGEVNFDGGGVNSFEACSVLNQVARLFGLTTPTEIYDYLCEASNDE